MRNIHYKNSNHKTKHTLQSLALLVMSVLVLTACTGDANIEESVHNEQSPNVSSETEALTPMPEDAEARILAGEIFCMVVSPDSTTAGQLDLDGDGEREVLCLYGISERSGGTGWKFWSEDHSVLDDKYRIQVNEQYYESYCDMMDPVLMAYSPDGEQILLALYDDGPSNDPKTTFFKYDAGILQLAGSIPDDLRLVTIDENGVIMGTFRADMIQTEWAYGYYIWNGKEMVMREDEVYYLVDDRGWREAEQMPLLLLEEVTVYEERSEESRAMVMKPQQVTNVATDRQEWVLLEAVDGTRGWLRVKQWKVPQLGDKSIFKIFEGLYMAD